MEPTSGAGVGPEWRDTTTRIHGHLVDIELGHVRGEDELGILEVGPRGFEKVIVHGANVGGDLSDERWPAARAVCRLRMSPAQVTHLTFLMISFFWKMFLPMWSEVSEARAAVLWPWGRAAGPVSARM